MARCFANYPTPGPCTVALSPSCGESEKWAAFCRRASWLVAELISFCQLEALKILHKLIPELTDGSASDGVIRLVITLLSAVLCFLYLNFSCSHWRRVQESGFPGASFHLLHRLRAARGASNRDHPAAIRLKAYPLYDGRAWSSSHTCWLTLQSLPQ
jgi:hypothetical protein